MQGPPLLHLMERQSIRSSVWGTPALCVVEQFNPLEPYFFDSNAVSKGAPNSGKVGLGNMAQSWL